LKTVLGIALAGALLVGATAAAVVHLLTPVDARARPVTVVIRRGATAPEIGRALAAAGIVRAASHFVVAARVRGATRRLREGEYRLSPAMPLLEIVDRLARGEVVLHTVTIPEGFTAEQIVTALAARGLGEAAALREIVRRGARRYPYAWLRDVPDGSLEGYLFPDTYQLPRLLPEQEVIAQLLRRFDEVVVPVWRRSGSGRPLHEIVTIASMVEREARVPAERPLIAGVLYNRLARGWPLEVDATVLYALGRHKAVVTYADLQVESPYNTYRHAGLPPGPIASPGLGAITAALAPARTDYLFYVARPDGSHAFSRTLAEHLAAVRRYRRP